MAVIRAVERGLGRGFQAIVRKRGHSLSRVLTTRKAAQEWAGRVEAAIDVSGPDRPFNKAAWLPAPRQESAPAPDDSCPHGAWTVGRALEHYAETVSIKKKGAVQEQSKAVAVGRAGMAGIPAGPADVRGRAGLRGGDEGG